MSINLKDDLGREDWMCAGFTLFSAVVGLGFSLLSLNMAGNHEYALYAASRSVAIPLSVLFAMAVRSRGSIAALALTMVVVQLGDAFVGLRLHDPGRSYGPVAFAAINLGLLWWMLSYSSSKANKGGSSNL